MKAETLNNLSAILPLELTNQVSVLNRSENGIGSTKTLDVGFDESWADVTNRLIGMESLQNDWDGEGSVAPDRGGVAGAIKLASALQAKSTPVADRVTAGVNGTICFEWHTADCYQEIEVSSPVDAQFRRIPKDSHTAEVMRIILK
jgi:hypothetical protein